MKRAAASVDHVDRPYTQQPVSCQFCRSRKLKCDRSRPCCFNCKSRNYECIYEADQREPSISTIPPGDSHANSTSSNGEELTLALRVERLEQVVFAKHSTFSGKVTGPSKAPVSRLARHDEEQQKTSQWLEGLLTVDTLGESPATSSTRADVAVILQDLPTYKDATTLLHHFMQTIYATYPMLHHSTTWHLLRMMYDDLATHRIPSATQLAFFLYIFAAAAYVSKETFAFESRSLQGYSQISLAEIWTQRAVRLVTEPPIPPSIEALQTIVGLVHLCSQVEGLGGNFGTLGMFGIQMARTMKIHRLDARADREERLRDGADMVSLEIKRRIWWHMVASDWLLSFSGGPNNGTYMLHPRQMETFRPSNVDDANIPVGITHITEESYKLPMTSPTSVSYFLHRVDAATLIRESVDSLPPWYFASPVRDTSDETYDTVMRLDRKYQERIQSLPSFFQLTIRDAESYQQLLKERPYLEWQRYLINLVLHTQLARLHQPFLIRGSREAKYEHSRLQCIRSAETVIEIRNRAMSDHSTGSFTYVLQHFLSAAIILAMDVCFNPDKEQAPRRKQQVMHACRALEEEMNAKLISSDESTAQDISSSQLVVRSFQNAVKNLRGTLRKYVREDELEGSAPLAAREILSAEPEPQHDFGNTENIIPPVSHTPTDEPSDLLVDELWNDFFAVGPTFNEADWDEFFSDVGANMG